MGHHQLVHDSPIFVLPLVTPFGRRFRMTVQFRSCCMLVPVDLMQH